MIVHTEAIVLSRMEYGETSHIVRLFTRDRGKIGVIAKGARRMKSKFGSSLEPLSHTSVVFYYRSNRGLQTLTESSHLSTFQVLQRDLGRLSVGFRMLELTQALMQDEHRQTGVYDLLLASLKRLNSADRHVENLLPYFQLQVAASIGIRPHIEREVVESLPPTGGALDLERGMPLATEEAASHATGASRTSLRAFAILARAPLDSIMRMELKPAIRQEVEHLISDYLRYHLQESYPDRSSRVIGQMERELGLSSDP